MTNKRYKQSGNNEGNKQEPIFVMDEERENTLRELVQKSLESSSCKDLLQLAGCSVVQAEEETTFRVSIEIEDKNTGGNYIIATYIEDDPEKINDEQWPDEEFLSMVADKSVRLAEKRVG